MTSAAKEATSIKSLKKKCLYATSNDIRGHWDDHLSSLEVQGDIVELEREEGSWRKIMSMGLPSGQLSFILRAGSDTLPHPLNLKRWKIQCDWKCQLCLPITVHFLNGCPSALQQGRYAWRHDSVLLTILLGLKPFLPPNCKVFADLDLWRAEDNPLATIPPHILSTPLRPDMVAIWPDRKKINLLELTVPTCKFHQGARPGSLKETAQAGVSIFARGPGDPGMVFPV